MGSLNRDILRTVRAETGLLLDFSQGQRSEFAGAISRVLNALALVDGMGYCQVTHIFFFKYLQKEAFYGSIRKYIVLLSVLKNIRSLCSAFNHTRHEASIQGFEIFDRFSVFICMRDYRVPRYLLASGRPGLHNNYRSVV